MVDRRILQKRQASTTGDDEGTTRSSSAASSARPTSSARPSSATPSAASSSRRSSSATPSSTSSSRASSSVASSSSGVSSSSAPSSTVTSSTTSAAPTSLVVGPSIQEDGGVVTITRTITPTPTSSVRAAAATAGADNGFFDNKAAVGATFAIVGLAVVAIIGILVTIYIRRRRAKKFERDVSAAAAVVVQNPFAYDDDDRSHSNASQGALYGTPMRHREQLEQFVRYGDAYGMRQIEVEPPPATAGIAGFGAASAVRRSRTQVDRPSSSRTSHPPVVAESEEEDRYDSQAQLRNRGGPPSASSQGVHENYNGGAYDSAAYQGAAAAARSSLGHGHNDRAIPSSVISPTSLKPLPMPPAPSLPDPHSPPHTPPYPRRSLDEPGQNPFLMPIPGPHTPETQSLYSRQSFERDQDRRMPDLRFSSAFPPPSVPDGRDPGQGRRF